MNERLEKLKVVQSKIDAIRASVPDAEEAIEAMRNETDEERIAQLRERVNPQIDDLLVFLRENFGEDEDLCRGMPIKANVEYTEEEQKVAKDIRGVLQDFKIFNAEELVEARDSVIAITAMKTLFSTYRVPFKAKFSPEFESFTKNYKVAMLGSAAPTK